VLTVHQFYDLVDPFVRQFEDGHTLLTSPGVSLEKQVAEESSNAESYRFFVPKQGVGLIDFRTFQNLERFQGFLKTTFSQIKTQGIQTLIIDLRDNGGGNGALGNALLEYITDKPYRQFSRYEVKVSSQARAWFLSNGGNLPWADGQEIGSVYKAEEAWNKPASNSLRFLEKFLF
jgi:Peptidase family S41